MRGLRVLSHTDHGRPVFDRGRLPGHPEISFYDGFSGGLRPAPDPGSPSCATR